MVAGYLVAEAVVGVGEDGAGGVQKTIDGGGKFGRERIAGLLLEEAEEGRFEADAGFTEHLDVGGEKEICRSSLFSSRVITEPGRRTTWVLGVISYFFRSMASVA